MISRRHLLATAAVSGAAVGAPPALASPAYAAGDDHAGGGLRVQTVTTEYADRPLGLDSPRPRLSWTLSANAPDQLQHAYRICVASSPGRLTDPDVWDSGKRDSRQSVLVPYEGPALEPRTRYHFSVRVWGGDGRPSPWSAPSWWETGLMGREAWRAGWISPPGKLVAPPGLTGTSWIWFPEGDPASRAPAATRWFRGAAMVTGTVRRAQLVIAADDGFTAHLNGTGIATREALAVQKAHSRPSLVDVTREVRRGANVLAVSATNAEEGPAGLLALLEITTDEGTTRFGTDDGWKTSDEKPDGDWQDGDFDDSGWSAAREVAAWGDGPWGEVLPQQSPAQLRRSFRVPGRRISRARLYATALGLYEAHLNGQRVGHDRLTPGWTDYRKRVAYQTYDVTDAVRTGENALAVTLAPGWYAGNVAWFGQQQYGERPALLTQLEVTYQDGGTDTFVTDAQWRTATGPLVTSDLVMGEEYDARAETPGWTAPGFDDAGWQSATAASGISTEVVAMTDAPTRVMKEVEPVKVTEPRPGVFLFDL
ncbi:MAG TPA: alpha-L-rhamnosidase N-terminal domain-containing protein, partial [Streptomyces sp.]|nr:alpha-L-rhamnosidase N-terminal domain-containing protein [Streptomyces sp.]